MQSASDHCGNELKQPGWTGESEDSTRARVCHISRYCHSNGYVPHVSPVILNTLFLKTLFLNNVFMIDIIYIINILIHLTIILRTEIEVNSGRIFTELTEGNIPKATIHRN